MSDIIKVEGYTGITAVGWNLAGITDEQWKGAGELLTKINRASQWWLGDWWNACPWGNGKSECEKLGINSGTAEQYAKTCRKIPMLRRVQDLSFSHHKEVCRLSTENLQDEFLEKSLQEGWTAQQLRSAIDDFKKFDDWEKSELERKALVEEGVTVVANCKEKTDEHLIQWAKDNKKYVFVGRSQYDIGWGNPYELDKDGDRDTVCDSHEHYFERKYSLHEKVKTLRGKVLGCFCHPERCHGDNLARWANEVEG